MTTVFLNTEPEQQNRVELISSVYRSLKQRRPFKKSHLTTQYSNRLGRSAAEFLNVSSNVVTGASVGNKSRYLLTKPSECDNIGPARFDMDIEKVRPTGFPHIIKIEGVCGGEAIIEGTRIAVWHIVGYYYKVGMSVEEILTEWEYLTPAQVFSALAYYHDNRDEIDQVRQRNSYEQWLENYAHAAV